MWEFVVEHPILSAIAFVILAIIGMLYMLSRFYRKVGPEEALVKTGWGGLKVVTGSGMMVVPVAHRIEFMDLSVKRIEIKRQGSSGLICRDNVRADIEVGSFVRVNNETESIKEVAQAHGCAWASDKAAMVELSDAKFSEAIKTVSKLFDFVKLYNERDTFKTEIIGVIGRDLNGYVLEDAAIEDRKSVV